MPSLIDLRRRIRAVKSTQQITKAMKMIAASRLKRAQDRVIAARPFAQRMLAVLNGLVSRVDPEMHPLLRIPRLEGDGGKAGPSVEYLYEPGPQQIFQDLLPRHVQIQVYRALLES